MNPINEILQEIKNKCDIDTYAYLESFIHDIYKRK